MALSVNEPWHISWAAIHAYATSLLNDSATLPPSVSHGRPFHGLPRLRLWEDATGFVHDFEPTTLTVYEVFDDNHRRYPVVREAVWRRWPDLSRIQEGAKKTGKPVLFEPEIIVRDAAVPADQFAGLLTEAQSFQVPITWFSDSESVTCDVGGRGFAFYSQDQPTASIQLAWGYETPPQWEPVMQWYTRVWQFLDGCLPLQEKKPNTEPH